MRFDPIAVRIDDEGGIVVGTIIGAQAWLAVVAPAVIEGCGMKRIDTAAAWCGEAEMQA